MAVTRPWITPEDVKNYTSHKDVAERPAEKLAFDISRAELKIIHLTTNNKFEDYEELPEPVRIAAILVAEAYAKNDIEATKKKIKSESFDDYSYTVESSVIDLDSLDLDELLADYVVEKGIGKVKMVLRNL